MSKYVVGVTQEITGFVVVEADDEFEARMAVLNMTESEIEDRVPQWDEVHGINVTDNIYEVR